MSSRINYDQIAKVYDSDAYRVKPSDPQLHEFLQMQRNSETKRLKVLDLGCGTGNQLISDKKQFPDLSYTGIDFSRGMLEQGRRKDSEIEWLQADVQNLPFDDNIFDYMSSQYQYHHVENKERMFSEAYRCLKPGGWFVLVNSCPEMMLDWPVYKYFPATLTRDRHDFLATDQVRSLLSSAGFRIRDEFLQMREISDKTCDYLAGARRKTSCSQLVALSDADWQKGLAQMERALSDQEYVDYRSAEITWVSEK